MPTTIFKGLVFPEDILQTRVKEFATNLQSNTPLLKELLQRRDTYTRDSILNAITKFGIKVIQGYPRSQVEVPAIVITLASSQDDTSIGGELEIKDVPIPDTSATLNDPIEMLDGTGTEIEITLGEDSLDIPATGVLKVDDEIMSYTAGSNTQFTIQRRKIYNTDRAYHDVDSAISFIKIERLFGSYDQMSLRLDVLDNNLDIVNFIANLLRAVLRGNAHLLERDGLMEVSISATDHAPRPEFIPNEAFTRTIVLSFKSELSFPGEALQLITGVETEITPPIEISQNPNP